MGQLSHAMTQTCDVITTTVNKFGDFVATNTQSIACRFRYINELNVANNREAIESDALAWFEPDSGVVEGTIFRINGEFYRVRQLIKARRLTSDTVLFFKALCEKYHSVDVS